MASINTGQAIGVALLLYVLAAVLPGAFDNFFGVNTTSWDSGTAALWLLIPLFAVIFFIVRLAKDSDTA